MAKTIKRKDRKLNVEVENKKDFIAYDSVKVYARTDIPITPTDTSSVLLTPTQIWDGFSVEFDKNEVHSISETDVLTRYTFCPFLGITTEVFYYHPTTPSQKTVLLIGERSRLPQQNLIDALVAKGYAVVVPDYNGVGSPTLTHFSEELAYGKVGNENGRDQAICPTAKDTCQYLYSAILRKLITFINDILNKTDIVIVGIRNGTELAMQVAGLERERVIALGCICGAGYPECTDLPKTTGHAFDDMDYEALCWMTGVSGVAYMKKYPHPVFAGIGTNGYHSDVDRLSNLATLISGRLTSSISLHCSENINYKSFSSFLTWLDYVYYKSEYPKEPITVVSQNSEGYVYANTTTKRPLPITRAVVYYSYGNDDHKTRFWRKSVCQTVGKGEYIARLDISSTCSYVYYFAEITYVNGMVLTETPKYKNFADKRITLSHQKSNALIFQSGMHESIPFSELSVDAVLPDNGVTEITLPSGVSGATCKTGSMRIFIGDKCKSITSDKILQVDNYCNKKTYLLTLKVGFGNGEGEFVAKKSVYGASSFVTTKFSCSDFKNAQYKPLSSWQNVSSLTIEGQDVVVNKLIFL